MKLCLVQHGHAVPKEDDPDRPLSESGRRNVERLADRLAALNFSFSAAWHSGKLRARQTAEIIAGHLPEKVPVITRDGLLPKDPAAPIAEQLQTEDENVLIASHLPFLSHLASLLLTGDESTEVVSFEPGTALCLEDDDSGGWRVLWMLPPALTR